MRGGKSRGQTLKVLLAGKQFPFSDTMFFGTLCWWVKPPWALRPQCWLRLHRQEGQAQTQNVFVLWEGIAVLFLSVVRGLCLGLCGCALPDPLTGQTRLRTDADGHQLAKDFPSQAVQRLVHGGCPGGP